jgi:flagellar biosynthesis protein FliP
MKLLIHSLLLALFVMAGSVSAQAPTGNGSGANSPGIGANIGAPAPFITVPGAPLPLPQGSVTAGGLGNSSGSLFNLQIGDPKSKRLTSTVEIVLLMTMLTLAPAILLTLTSFTRIIIVLSFMKRAMSIQEMPPSLVVTGLSFFLTIFIMKPVLVDLNETALQPYQTDQITMDEAGTRAASIMGDWLLKQTRVTDLALMYEISNTEMPEEENLREETPFHLIVPAFVISEIKTAFQMGFVLFLPFLVIDIVIASLLISMGMFTLPPVVISTPFKILLFVLVDGWNIVLKSAIESFYA